jgi:hypothetical protein
MLGSPWRDAWVLLVLLLVVALVKIAGGSGRDAIVAALVAVFALSFVWALRRR